MQPRGQFDFMSKKDYKKCFDDYYEQKELQRYQENRVLEVPTTSNIMLVGWALLFVSFVIFDMVFCILLIRHTWLRISTIVFSLFVIFEFYGRFLGIKIVECYQHYATEETRRRCLCVPSCSEYAILCFKKFGLIKALLKIRKRLYVTCQGPDYKIDWP